MRTLLATVGITQALLCGLCWADNEAQLSLDGIIAKVAAQERRLQNLHVISASTVLRREPGKPDWTSTPMGTTMEAWHDGLPDGLARIEVRDSFVPWADGPDPHGRGSFSMGFDGTTGWIARHTAGPSDKPFRVMRGYILPGRPTALSRLTYGMASGMAFSLYGYEDGFGGVPLSERLEEIRKHSLGTDNLEITSEELMGDPVVCIRARGSGVQVTYRLDPARNMAFRGHEHASEMDDGTLLVMEEMVVKKLTDCGDGLWFPAEAYRETGNDHIVRAGQRWRVHELRDAARTVFEAKSVTANDPEFSQDVFTMEFPPGYRIRDQRTGLVFVTGLNEEPAGGVSWIGIVCAIVLGVILAFRHWKRRPAGVFIVAATMGWCAASYG